MLGSREDQKWEPRSTLNSELFCQFLLKALNKRDHFEVKGDL